MAVLDLHAFTYALIVLSFPLLNVLVAVIRFNILLEPASAKIALEVIDSP